MTGVLTRLMSRRSLDENSGRGLIDKLRNPAAMTAAGVAVTPDTALTYSAVWACVRVLAEDVASLPLILYRRLPGGGKERATDHPLYRLLHDAPNSEMSSMDWREAQVTNLCLWGNGYSQVRWNRGGRIVDIWPMLSRYMRLDRHDGQLRYLSTDPAARAPELPATEVLHTRTMSLNGLVGLSPIALARQAIGLGLATERFGAAFFNNGARPGLVLMSPGELSDGAYERIKNSWTEAHSGVENAHKPAILEQGTTIETIGVPPEEAQFLQTRQFQVLEVARWFRMQPHKIGDLSRATFSNVEEQGLDYVVNTLRVWLTRLEQAISRTLLTSSERDVLYAEFLVDGLLRGDQKARYDAYALARSWGWMNANEIRERENMNAIPGGDAYWTPLNMTTTGATPAAAKDSQANAVRALAAVYRDAVERVARRAARDIGELARKHLAKGDVDAFGRGLAALGIELREYAERAITPCVTAHATLSGAPAERIAPRAANDFAGWWIQMAIEMVRGMVDGARAAQIDLVSAVDTQLRRWDADRISEWALYAATCVRTALQEDKHDA